MGNRDMESPTRRVMCSVTLAVQRTRSFAEEDETENLMHSWYLSNRMRVSSHRQPSQPSLH
jgi:hypothetical protein